MKRILFLAMALLICCGLPMDGQTRKAAGKRIAKSKTTAIAKTTPASDLSLFGLKGKVKKLVENRFIWIVTDPVYDEYGSIDSKASKPTLEPYGQRVYYFTEDGFLSGYQFIGSDGSTKRYEEIVADSKGRLAKACYDEEIEDEVVSAQLDIKRNIAEKMSSYTIFDRRDPACIIHKGIITLRPDGKIAKIKHNTLWDSWTQTYIYNTAGMLTKTVNKNSIDTFAITWKYEPERDANGNWFKAENSDSEVVERQFEYYE